MKNQPEDGAGFGEDEPAYPNQKPLMDPGGGGVGAGVGPGAGVGGVGGAGVGAGAAGQSLLELHDLDGSVLHFPPVPV